MQEPAGQRGRAISGKRSRSRLRWPTNPNQIVRLSRDFYTHLTGAIQPIAAATTVRPLNGTLAHCSSLHGRPSVAPPPH